MQKFTDVTQTVQTTFEQIKELREKGQVEQAGKLQQGLLADTLPKIDNINTQASLVSAIEKGDQKALQDAIAKATLELQKVNERAAKRESVEQGITDINNVGNGNWFTNMFKSDESYRAGAKS